MSPVRPLLDSLLIYDPNRSSSTANIWIAHPSPSEEAVLGKIFMVASIDSNDRLNHEIIGALQEQLKHSYYHSTEPKFSAAFEQALHLTNQHLHRLIIEGVDGWVERLHCVVGVLVGDQLLIAHAGSMMAYVLRRGRMHDILGNQSQSINPLKIFSNIVEGKLEDQDKLLLCTPTVLDYFSLEKLRRTLADHTPAESVRILETSLLGSDSPVALAALLLQIEGHLEAPLLNPIPPREIGRPSTVAPQRSMESLIARERATEQLLTPSIWPSVRDTGHQFWSAVNRFIRMTILRRPPKRALPAGQVRASVSADPRQSRPGKTIKYIRLTARRLQVLIIGKLQILRSTWQRRKTRRHLQETGISPALPKPGGHWLHTLVGSFKRLARTQQLIITGALVLVFVFTAVIINSNRTPAFQAGQIDQLILEIEEHLTKAEAALLYGGDDTARTQIKSATDKIGRLPAKSKDQRTQISELTDRAKTVQTQLQKMVTIQNPEIVAQLAEVAPTLRPAQLYLAGPQIFAYDPGKQTGVKINLETTDAPVVIRNSIDTGQPTTGVTISETNILFATERLGFVELNLETDLWRPLDATWPSGAHTVQGIAFFQNRIYALDRASGTIIRFARGANSLGVGTSWLKETAPLQTARGLAVDGSIFVLQPNGQVQEYFNGRLGEFALVGIDPVLKNPTRIFTSVTSSKIYLVDPANKRLVVFDKNGKLVRQYQSSSWGSLADVAVNEGSKTAFIMNGTTLYRLNLQD